MSLAWRTTKLIEGGHRGLQAYRPICYYVYVFLRFLRFFKIQKTWLFTFFCRISYVLSNYGEIGDVVAVTALTPMRILTQYWKLGIVWTLIHWIKVRTWKHTLKPWLQLRFDYDTTIPRRIRLRRKWSKLRSAFYSTAIRLRHDYDEKLTCSFFARVEWKQARATSRIVVVS